MNTTYTSISAVLILVIVAIAFNACKPESTGELGDPFDKVAGLEGTWELSSFTQQDLNSPVKETRDLSAFYIDGTVTPLQLTFNLLSGSWLRLSAFGTSGENGCTSAILAYVEPV